ncbi:hypothetical protein Nmel_012868, partial [Mimus melanotis]|jgi:hypothetical protein
MLKG